jgi:hypothetical protein
MRKKDGFTNYDESAFLEPAAIGSDEEIVDVAKAQHKLAEFLDRKNFKSYDELKKKLDQVLSGDAFASKSAAAMSDEDEMPTASAPKIASKPAPTPKASVSDDDEEDVMSYFKKIAQEE